MNQVIAEPRQSPSSSSSIGDSVRPAGRNVIWYTLLLTFLLMLLLQAWRPMYHLSDDNLSQWLPLGTEMYRNLWSGEWPFSLSSLCEGRYDLASDPLVFLLLSPWAVLFSWLALTDYYLILPDVISTCNALAITGAFAWFALRLKERLQLEISSGWIVVASLSYGFTPFNLMTAASWLGFVTAQAAMPLVIGSLFLKSFWRGALLIAGAVVYAVYGSHLQPVVFTCLFSGLFAVGKSLYERSWRPTGQLAAGAMMSTPFILPLLIVAVTGFTTTDRAAGVTIAEASVCRVPFGELVASYLAGPFKNAVKPGVTMFYTEPAFTSAVAFAFINLPLIVFIALRRRFGALEKLAITCCGVAALLIARPLWVAELFQLVPFFKSMRWPFREMAMLHFFAHFLFLLYAKPIRHRALTAALAVSTVGMGILPVLPAPTFNPLALDRDLIVSGTAQGFWKDLKSKVGDTPVVSVVPFWAMRHYATDIPFPLLGAFNYASILGIVNVSAYSPSLPAAAKIPDAHPYHHSGVFAPQVAADLMQKRPELTMVTLLKVNPTLLQVRSREKSWYFWYQPDTGKVVEVKPPAKAAENPAIAE